jgi:hypothetical protein
VVASVGLKCRSSEFSVPPIQSSLIKVPVDHRSKGDDNVISSNDKDHHRWPLLNDLIDDENTTITQDVQFLVDFAIAGHPKTGTSTLMRLS